MKTFVGMIAAPTLALCAAFLVAIVASRSTAAEYKESEMLLGKLKESKRPLADGVRQTEQEEGIAISAKFELEGEELSLSVYTAKERKGTDAEHNMLMKLSGNPTKETWTPKKEVFADKEHIARASMHLTLMQLSLLSLVDVIKKAEARVHLAVDLLSGTVS